MNIKNVENIINAHIDGNNQKIINILQAEIKIYESKGWIEVARKLKHLVKKIPKEQKKQYSQSGFILEKKNENSTLYEKSYSEILLEEVVLDEKGKVVMNSFLREWEDYDKLVKHHIFPTNKILLFGPPGTGKTKLAYALANKLDFPLILVRLDELISSYLGKTGKNIREIFELAKKENVVIFLDEIDTVAKNRNDERELGELKRVVTVLLQNIDNFPLNSIIIGATNHEGLLDKAIWRRFPLKLKLDFPTHESTKRMLKMFLKEFDSDLDYDLLSKLCVGFAFTGSSIFDLTQMIIKESILNNSKIDLINAIKNIFLLSNSKNLNIKFSKKHTYEICQILKNEGLSVQDIHNMSGIPYTTLRDNIK